MLFYILKHTHKLMNFIAKKTNSLGFQKDPKDTKVIVAMSGVQI